MTCQRCSDCRTSDHHWMPNGDFGADDNDPDFLAKSHRHPTGNAYICKHCDAVGDGCERCEGTGEFENDYAVGVDCVACNGAGIVAAPPKKYADLD